MTKRYRPSNGEEGIAFMADWCDRCSRDREHGGCSIVALTLCLKVDNPEYPSEWVYDADGQPCCTAFEKED